MSYLTLIITVPFTIFCALFVVQNTGYVDIALIPGMDNYHVPVYLAGLALLIGGFFLGALFVFLHSQKTQIRYWQEKSRAAKLEKELDALQAKQAAEEARQLLPAGRLP